MFTQNRTPRASQSLTPRASQLRTSLSSENRELSASIESFGSDQGTSDAPKFSLKSLFQDHLFPKLDSLVRKGGLYEGYKVIIQGDNAGPHVDDTYLSYCAAECAARNWMWEPQAPQMPHANVLDLAVFPAMSKRHGAMLREYSSREAPADEIWRTAWSVWCDELTNDKVARGFVLAHRILKKVIATKGENSFLQKSFHSNVRSDFYTERDGSIAKKAIVPAP